MEGFHRLRASGFTLQRPRACSQASITDNWICVNVCLQKQDKAMLELAKQLKDANSLMFFARGNNYATALEAALKVRSVFGVECGGGGHAPVAGECTSSKFK